MRQCLKILAVEEEEVQEVVQPEEESQRFSEHKLQEGADEGARVTSEEVAEAEDEVVEASVEEEEEIGVVEAALVDNYSLRYRGPRMMNK